MMSIQEIGARSNKFLDTLKATNNPLGITTARRTVDVMCADCHDLAGNKLL